MTNFFSLYLVYFIVLAVTDKLGWGIGLNFNLLSQAALLSIISIFIIWVRKLIRETAILVTNKVREAKLENDFNLKTINIFLKIFIDNFSCSLRAPLENINVSATFIKMLAMSIKFSIFFLILIITFVDIFSYKEKFSILIEDTEIQENLETTVKLIAGEKITGRFVASEDNLGILAVKFRTDNRVIDDILTFKIKETGAHVWYENQYNANQFQNNKFFTFGFPVIRDSKGKAFEFAIESMEGERDSAISVVTNFPIRLKYHFPTELFLENKRGLIKYLTKKAVNTLQYVDCPYLLFYLSFITGAALLCRKNTSFSLPLLLFYTFITSIFSIHEIKGSDFNPWSVKIFSISWLYNLISFSTVLTILFESFIKSRFRHLLSTLSDIKSENLIQFKKLTSLYRLKPIICNSLQSRLHLGFAITLLFFKNFYLAKTMVFYNSDEVRLLYDAVLINKGFTPFIDYMARAPLLIYFLSIFTRLGIRQFEFYYFLSVLMIVISGLLIYLIAKEIFNKKIAYFSLVSFLIAPMTINLIYVKTQTYSIPITLISTYIFLKYIRRKKLIYLLLSLSFLCLSLLIRESSLAVLFALFLLDYIYINSSLVKRLLKWGLMGFVATLPYFLFQRWVFVNSKIQILPIPEKGLFFRTEAINNLLNAQNYISPIFGIILLSAIIFVIATYLSDFKKNIKYLYPLSVLSILILLYLYNFFRHGFWPEYLLEFLPYICLIMGIFLTWFLKSKQETFLILSILALSTSLSIPIVRRKMGIYPISVVNREIAPVIKSIGEGNQILAGVPLFAFLTNNDNILRYSHTYYKKENVEKIIEYARTNPPKIIVKDPYWDYFEEREKLEQFTNENYVCIKRINSIIEGKPIFFEIYKLEEIKSNF